MYLKNKAKVIEYVVENDLCVGCGLCVSQSKNALTITMNSKGFWEAQQLENVLNDDELLEICPFNPFPKDDVRTEDEIASLFLKDTPKYDPEIGRFQEIYAGYAVDYRVTSSSGGMATYICNELLQDKIVDAIIVVKQQEKGNSDFYEYAWITEVQNVKQSSKTRYYPVHLSQVMEEAIAFNGKLAVVGISCFIKGIRLLQKQQPVYKEKIPFLIGIICGGLKSKYYTDYLASHSLKNLEGYIEPEYRIKDAGSVASDYSFGCTSTKDGALHTTKMNSLPDMWGTGYFKANACDFCEDVSTELADISLGDAWIKPFNEDGLGNNVIIPRSEIASQIIEKGKDSGALKITKISKKEFKKSQSGSFNHRHKALLYRTEKRRKNGFLVPPKRERNLNEIGSAFKIVQELRMLTRINSIKIWVKYRNHVKFDKKMFLLLKSLGLASRIYRKMR